jgi:hypothetical protein
MVSLPEAGHYFWSLSRSEQVVAMSIVDAFYSFYRAV